MLRSASAPRKRRLTVLSDMRHITLTRMRTVRRVVYVKRCSRVRVHLLNTAVSLSASALGDVFIFHR